MTPTGPFASANTATRCAASCGSFRRGTSIEARDPTVAAHREFEEETGLRIGHLEHLGSYTPIPSLADFAMHMYFGHTLTPGRQHLDANELLEVERVPIKELRDAILAGPRARRLDELHRPIRRRAGAVALTTHRKSSTQRTSRRDS